MSLTYHAIRNMSNAEFFTHLGIPAILHQDVMFILESPISDDAVIAKLTELLDTDKAISIMHYVGWEQD